MRAVSKKLFSAALQLPQGCCKGQSRKDSEEMRQDSDSFFLIVTTGQQRLRVWEDPGLPQSILQRQASWSMDGLWGNFSKDSAGTPSAATHRGCPEPSSNMEPFHETETMHRPKLVPLPNVAPQSGCCKSWRPGPQWTPSHWKLPTKVGSFSTYPGIYTA